MKDSANARPGARRSNSAFSRLEQAVFRSLNTVVEPAVRLGIGSPRLTPASLIVLETEGFKSGARRRTPLWSIRLGKHRLISTARGNRSFWVKNLRKKPDSSYYLGGCRRESHAIVIADGVSTAAPADLSPGLQRLATVIARYAPAGWTFAILTPTGP
jgi:F420H(2)-dependent quinone reductase